MVIYSLAQVPYILNHFSTDQPLQDKSYLHDPYIRNAARYSSGSLNRFPIVEFSKEKAMLLVNRRAVPIALVTITSQIKIRKDICLEMI